MSLNVIWTTQFKKDYKLLQKQGLQIKKLDRTITLLANKKVLPKKYGDHQLIGNFKRFRECHIAPDWLLIYCIDDNDLVLTLIRTGSHTRILKI